MGGTQQLPAGDDVGVAEDESVGQLEALAAENRALGAALAGLAARIDVLHEAFSPIDPVLAGLARRLDALEAGTLTIGPSVLGLSERVDALSDTQTTTTTLRDLTARIDSMETKLTVDAVSRWVAHGAPPVRDTLISIITPTRNRPELLRRAIASVCAQTHPCWEMVVVDDGGDVDSAAVVAEAADPRIRHTRIESSGVCAARNHALGIASGSLVAYLDDDNVMDPGWLRAVAWAFAEHPGADVIYGGLVIDDLARAEGRGRGVLPQLYLQPWDRHALLSENLTDMNAIAHRAGLAQAHFDESLEPLGDWDLLIRLTTRKPALVVPVVAGYYSTAEPDRLSHRFTDLERCRRGILAAHAIERRLGPEQP